MTTPIARFATALTAVLFPIFALAQQSISAIEVNQAIGVQKNNGRKFVAGKDAVVRAFLPSPVTVVPAQTSATITRDGLAVATIAPNSYDGPTAVVDFLCPSRETCGNWAAGSYTFDVTVNGAGKSTAGTAYDFVERATIRVLALAVKANYGGKIVSVKDDRWKNFADYVRKTYPIAADKFIWVTRDEIDASDASFDLETDNGRLALWEALAKLIPPECNGNPNAEGCFTQVFGFINDRPNGFPNGRLQGYTYGKPANIGVSTDEDAPATVAHEIGHTYGLGDTYDGGSFACGPNPAPDNFRGKDINTQDPVSCTAGRVALENVSATKIPAAQHPYEVGGRGPLPDAGEYMGSGGKQEQFWTTQDAYDHLFDRLVPAPVTMMSRSGVLAAPQRFVQCWGTIRENASTSADVHLDPCWAFQDTDPIPDTTGPYMMAAVNAAGARLATQVLDLQFNPVGPKGQPSPHLTSAPFESSMSFPAGTAKLQFIHNGNVLMEVPVSANPPAVTNVAPQATGTVNGPVTITWDASDPDGNTLSYEVEYNADVTDPHSEWETLMRDITLRRFTIDFAQMPGSAHAKLRVVATDGFNTGEGESATFAVPAKAPEVFIEPLPSGGFVFPGREVVLDGDAFDLLDDDIPESSLEWSSNISGVLGHGSPLKVTLPAGIHTITLKATNSENLTGSATTVVRVFKPQRHRAARH